MRSTYVRNKLVLELQQRSCRSREFNCEFFFPVDLYCGGESRVHVGTAACREIRGGDALMSATAIPRKWTLSRYQSELPLARPAEYH